MKTTWTQEMRESAQNSNYRQDVLCMCSVRMTVQATRQEPAKELGYSWVGHSCIGDITFSSLDKAREFALEMGYNGIYL